MANREVYRLLKEGIPVSVADPGDSTSHPDPVEAERVAELGNGLSG